MYPNPRLTPLDRSDSDSAPLPALRPLPYSHSAACLACRSNVVTLTRLVSVENRNIGTGVDERLVHTRQKKHCKRAPLGCTSSALGTTPTLHPAQANTPSPQSTRQLADATAQYQYSPKTFLLCIAADARLLRRHAHVPAGKQAKSRHRESWLLESRPARHLFLPSPELSPFGIPSANLVATGAAPECLDSAIASPFPNLAFSRLPHRDISSVDASPVWAQDQQQVCAWRTSPYALRWQSSGTLEP
ncbi:hypothetical protein IWZ01DRAFT_505538 [Phyllosticta capitalensis]